jgi:hypothetical protein
LTQRSVSTLCTQFVQYVRRGQKEVHWCCDQIRRQNWLKGQWVHCAHNLYSMSGKDKKRFTDMAAKLTQRSVSTLCTQNVLYVLWGQKEVH